MYGFNEGLFDDIVDIDVPDTAVVIDIDDTVDEGPEVGVATGIADMILRLINSENDTITEYNSARTTLAQDPTYAEFIEVIDDIEAEELKHVGQLQTLLKRLSPNASNIEAGEAEAESQLTEDLDNMERVTKGKKIDVHGEMPVVMADAVMASEEADKAVEDELEEHNKKTKVKLNKVLGAENQPVPKLPEMAKVTLDESLFEDFKDTLDNRWKIIEKVEEYLDEGHINKDDFIDMLLQWYYKEPTFVSFLTSNNIFSEDELDSFSGSFDESLKEDFADTNDIKIIVRDVIKNFKKITGVDIKSVYNTNSEDTMFNQSVIDTTFSSIDDYISDKYDLDSNERDELLYALDDELSLNKELYNESLNEGRKPIDFIDSHGDVYSDEDRWDEEEPEDDLFSKVMLELCPEGADWKKHSKFPEITGKDRYDTDELGVTYNGDIEVAVDDMNRLAFATRVGEAYDLPIRGPEKTRSGKFILTLKIEE